MTGDGGDIENFLPKVESKILKKVITYCKKNAEKPDLEDIKTEWEVFLMSTRTPLSNLPWQIFFLPLLFSKKGELLHRQKQVGW